MITAVVFFAGNLKEFSYYVDEKVLAWGMGRFIIKRERSRFTDPFGNKFFYVASSEQLRGCRGIKVEYYGSWLNRDDLDDIRKEVLLATLE